VYRRFERGKHFPADKCTQNLILLVVSGELLINSQEYPGTTLRDGSVVLQAIGSQIELLALTDVEYIVYWFNDLPKICEKRMTDVMDNPEAPLTYTPLVMNDRLEHFSRDLCDYLEEGMSCGPYIELKSRELVFLLTSYYPTPQLRQFFYPISSYTEGFHYFVMKNYEKVKNVEEFAHLGGYSITTFRRLFKNMYGVPVYEWMLDRKREGILNDLQNTRDRIGEISRRYGFDTMSHFAHFCKSSFGDTPRALRTKLVNGGQMELLTQK
jgi:AraC-like DNA-binding protein